MRFRPFRNSDPPLLAKIWSRQTPHRGYAREVTAELLDIYVFSKPYFDRQGLIVAEDDNGEVVGFAHAGFGPDFEYSNLSTELGVTCMVMTDPNVDFEIVGPKLLAECELYLKARGSKVIYGGGMYPLNPFYLGLYGGSESPGVLESDKQRLSLFQNSGYVESDRCVVLQRPLDGFRMPVDRRLLKLKKKYVVEHDKLPPPDRWWDACVEPIGEPTTFEIRARHGGPACGRVRFWVIDAMSKNSGQLSVGLTHLSVDESARGQGLATLLNAEALKQLQLGGVGLVEAQTMKTNLAAIGLYKKIGFQIVDYGIVFRKQA